MRVIEVFSQEFVTKPIELKAVSLWDHAIVAFVLEVLDEFNVEDAFSGAEQGRSEVELGCIWLDLMFLSAGYCT